MKDAMQLFTSIIPFFLSSLPAERNVKMFICWPLKNTPINPASVKGSASNPSSEMELEAAERGLNVAFILGR